MLPGSFPEEMPGISRVNAEGAAPMLISGPEPAGVVWASWPTFNVTWNVYGPALEGMNRIR